MLPIPVIISRIFAFVGRRGMIYGGLGVISGFVTFVFDLGLAMALQRFFMATDLIDSSGTTPFNIALFSPGTEAAILIACGVMRGAAAWANGYFTGFCQTAVEIEKRGEVAAWALSSGHESTGQVMTLFNDVMVGATANISNWFYMLSRFVLLAGLTGVMLSYSLALTGVVFLFILIAAPLQRLIDLAVSRNAKAIQKSLAAAVDILAISVKNGLFITLHDMVGTETARLQDRVKNYGHASATYYALASFRGVIPQTLGLIVVCLIAMQGAQAFADGRGALIAYLYLVLRLFQILSDLARASGSMRLNTPRLLVLWHWWCKHVDGVANSQTPSAPMAAGPIGWIAKNLTFRWNGDVITSIQNLNFSILPGQIVHIAGPSGTGKTTLMYVLIGLVPPTSGELLWTGQGQTRPLAGRLPVRISYVGSEPFIQPGSIRDQLLAGQGREISDAELWAALTSARADFVSAMPGGLDYQLTEQGIGLSAGQKQRIALARALLRHPSVLLLDEATANLDPETERDVLETIKSLRGNMTILMIAHRPHPALAPDQIITLGGQG